MSNPVEQIPVDDDLERQKTRGRVAYAPDVETQLQERLARTTSRRSRSRSRDSMSIRKSSSSVL